MRHEALKRRESMPVLKGVVVEFLFATALGLVGVLICVVINSIAG